jgi:hypothetical protein
MHIIINMTAPPHQLLKIHTVYIKHLHSAWIADAISFVSDCQ